MAKLLTATEIKETLLAFGPAVQSIAPQDVAGGVDGADAELNGEPALIDLNIGAASATTVFTPIVEESDDDQSYTTVAPANLLGGGALPTVTAATDLLALSRYYVGGKKHVRVSVSDDDGSTAALVMSATITPCRVLAFSKPFELDQIFDDLSRRSFERGGGDEPVQDRLTDIIV